MKYDGGQADTYLFDLLALCAAFAYVWAVVHRFDAAQLAVIGGTVFIAVWGNLRQHDGPPS